jgi:SAM-dependent methyltransferase
MTSSTETFDAVAARYEEALAEGLSITGEDSAYYAKQRVKALSSLLGPQLYGKIQRILDFGCGTGGSRPWIQEQWPEAEYLGYDPSLASLAVAKVRHVQPRTTWSASAANLGQFDLVLTNGVFHHIPPADRGAAFAFVRRTMKPDGVFAFFENNPWNPGTRYIMSHVDFDRDAITITPREARHVLKHHGFRPVHFTSLFYFPSYIAFLRPLESWLGALPLGGQYLHICKLQ